MFKNERFECAFFVLDVEESELLDMCLLEFVCAVHSLQIYDAVIIFPIL